MLLLELKKRITDVGAVTFPVRVGFAPDDVDECIVIRETPGPGAELGFGVPGIQYEHPVVQVEARGNPNEYEDARREIEYVFQDFPKVQAMTLTDTDGESGFYHTITPRNAPFLMYLDENRRPVIGCLFDVHKEPSA